MPNYPETTTKFHRDDITTFDMGLSTPYSNSIAWWLQWWFFSGGYSEWII